MLSSPLTMRRNRTRRPSAGSDPVPRSGPPRSCYVAVLGSSGPRTESESGVGKSSLCARFVNPGLDAYNAVKPGPDESVLAWMDFVEAEINQDHFMYYGSSARRLSGNTTAVIHVIEQTEFLDDASVGHTSYPAPGTYVQRATMRYIQSPGKVAYTRRSNIGAGVTSGAKRFPAAVASKGVSAYILVYDPTARDDRKQQQLALLAKLVERLPKDVPVALAIAKCDSLSPKQLGRLSGEHGELARCLQQRNQVIPCIHLSADMGVNVDLLFMMLASKALDVDFESELLNYEVATTQRHSEIRELQRELSGAVMDLTQQFQTRWHPVYNVLRRMPAYRRLSDLVGYEGVRRLFLARLLEIKMEDSQKVQATTVALETEDYDESGAASSDSSYQRVAYEGLEKSLGQHPDVRSDSKKVAEIYEDLEQVREARTWPRQSTASARTRDSRGTVYFPIAMQAPSHIAATTEADVKLRHGSCPTFRNQRPMSLMLDGEVARRNASPSPRAGSQLLDFDMAEKSVHASPRLNHKNQSRPRSVSPRARVLGLLDRLRLSPSHSAASGPTPPPQRTPEPGHSAVPQHLEVQHTRSHSLHAQQKLNTLSPSNSYPSVADQPRASSAMSSAKSLSYLPIVIPLPTATLTRHIRSASMHNPAAIIHSASENIAIARQGSPLASRSARSSVDSLGTNGSSSSHNQATSSNFGMSNIYAQPLRRTSQAKEVPSPIYRELEAAVADLDDTLVADPLQLEIEVSSPAPAPTPLYAELETPSGAAPTSELSDQDLLNTLV